MSVSTISMEGVNLEIAGRQILSSIDLTLTAGIHCLLGPNGSGKTMTNRLLALIQQVSSGNITWDNQLVNPIEKKDRLTLIRKIGYMRQEPVFISNNVMENIALPLKFRKSPKIMIEKRVSEILERFGLHDLAEIPISQLSTGQKQKVALARTLITDPDLLILDEPTSSLDMITTSWFEDLILQLHEEQSRIVVWTTHDQFQVKRVAESLSILLDGKVLISGNARDIIANPPEGIVKQYLQGRLVSTQSRNTERKDNS